jgi:gliding motility-associatede transport system auxiliary component
MKKIIDFLSPVGLTILVAALVWWRTGRTLPGGLLPYLVAGAVLCLVHLLLRWDDVTGRVGHRQVKYGTNTAVLVLVALGLAVAVNYLAYRHTKSWDFTKNQRYSLSDQTKKVVSGLKEDVKVTYLARSRELERGQDRLKPYEALSSRFTVEYVDPVKNPGKAQALDARGPWPVIVIERAANREKVTNDSEQDITNAIIKITRDVKKTVCFAEGEGERDIDDSNEKGYSGAKTALGKNQYQTKKVLLLREKKVPADCTVFVVSGPEKDLLTEETDAIRGYVKEGGKALVMVDPEIKTPLPNVDALLDGWNLEAGKDVVVDVSGMGQLFGAGEFTPMAASYPYHDITKDFRVATAFHMARSLKAGTKTVEGVTAQNLVETSPESWAETDLALKGRIQFDEGKDTKGPVPLGAVATVKGAAPAPSPSPSPTPSPSPASSPGASPSPSPSPEEEKKAPEGRVAAFGDSDFASNALLGFQGNQDFFLNTVAWLAQDADLISIRPKEPEDQKLFLQRSTQENVVTFARYLLPGLFVFAGALNWWKRR